MSVAKRLSRLLARAPPHLHSGSSTTARVRWDAVRHTLNSKPADHRLSVLQRAGLPARSGRRGSSWHLVPTHLRQGVTIAGIRATFASLPADAIEQATALTGDTRTLGPVRDGYVHQLLEVENTKRDGLTVCERMAASGNGDEKYVGEASVFVSWCGLPITSVTSTQPRGVMKLRVWLTVHRWMGTPLDALADALELWLHKSGRDPSATFFWICTFTIRQWPLATMERDSCEFGSIISLVKRTVMVLEPWTSPMPLKRAWCLFEMFRTVQVSSPFPSLTAETTHARDDSELRPPVGAPMCTCQRLAGRSSTWR